MRAKLSFVLVLGCLVALGGCATSRSALDIPTPMASQVAQDNGKSVYIKTIKDMRLFEVAPLKPDIPSLDPSEAQNDRIKLQAIGRKRNTFGKALGDILLKDGQTVESLTTASIRKAFREKGYSIIEDKDKIRENTAIVDADIVKFWSWMNPGFFALTLSTEISTNLTLHSAGGTDKLTVDVTAADSFQTGAESNWIEVINKALKDYSENLKSKLH